MKTDKELLKIFEAPPQWVFVLMRLPSPGNCTLRSIVIKALERRADAVIVPAASDQPLKQDATGTRYTTENNNQL